jgi:hypothetical protein
MSKLADMLGAGLAAVTKEFTAEKRKSAARQSDIISREQPGTVPAFNSTRFRKSEEAQHQKRCI